MFHINDFEAMDDARIKETADSMGIKKRPLHRAMT